MLIEPTIAEAQPSALAITWLGSLEEIESLSDEWRALEAAVHSRTVLSSFDFLVTWYRHYAGAYAGEPLVGVARRGHSLVGVAPLTVRHARLAGIPVTRVDFAPNDSPVGAFLVEDDHPETVTALLESLCRMRRFDVACFNGLDPDSDHLLAIRDAAAHQRVALELDDHAYAVADVSCGYQEYRAALSGHFRRNLNAKARKIEAAGGCVDGVLLDRGVDRRADFLARMIAVTEASYKLQGRRLGDSHRACLSELVERFGPRGMLSLTVLSIDGADAAYLFGLVERGCFYDINLAYDERFEKLSPGVYLTQRTIESLAAAGVHTVISHGAHEYKKHWASRFVGQKRAYLFTHGLRATAARVASRLHHAGPRAAAG